jgi:phosphohistidine swiveling domain-containing protein
LKIVRNKPMPKYLNDSDKYGDEAQLAIVEAFHSAIKARVRDHLEVSGESWRDFVFAHAETLTSSAACSAIEGRLVELGHRYEWSALVSQRERPDAYKPADGATDENANFSFEHPDARTGTVDSGGRRLCGQGDNVVGYAENTVGNATYVRSSERVLRYLTDGVPPGTIAVIDDSGGTLTAPILEQFAGVICAGGTVRSHLGILTREYGIPCLMNAKIAGIKEGDRVMLETTAPAKTAEAYQHAIEMTADIWLLSE